MRHFYVLSSISSKSSSERGFIVETRAMLVVDKSKSCRIYYRQIGIVCARRDSSFANLETRVPPSPAFRHSCLRELLRNSISSARQSVLLAGISSAVKSARAPRRLENVRNRRAMFYLDGRDGAAAKYDSSSLNGENFGWWLSDQQITVSRPKYQVKNHRSPGSPASILSCSDSDDSGSYSFVRDVSRQEQESGIYEKIELNSFTREDLDIDLIERDASETVSVTSYLLMWNVLKFPN